MRIAAMLMVLSIAGTCYADDPLETLNSVEDTVTTMQHTLKAQAKEHRETDGSLYFLSREPLGARGWVAVKPCGEEAAADAEESCTALAGQGATGGERFWKSRLAAPADLKPGAIVLAQDKGAWVVTRITDLSELDSGYVGTAAPFRTLAKGLRVVEE